MTRGISERDHRELRNFIAQTKRELASIKSEYFGRGPINYRELTCFAMPVARIPAASVISGDELSPGLGDATYYQYETNQPTIKFDKVHPDRGKIKLYNMHKGMWLWPNVVYRCVRDHHSGLWFAEHSQLWFKGKPTGTIAAGASGTMQVYVNNSPVSGLTVPSVRHDWMEGTNAVTTSHECLCQWFDAEDAWTIVNAECP